MNRALPVLAVVVMAVSIAAAAVPDDRLSGNAESPDGVSFSEGGHAALDQPVPQQILAGRSAVGDTGRSVADSAAKSISAPSIRPRLLPERMSFLERGLWGEEGILRTWGIASPLTPEVRKSELSLRRTMLTIHQIGGFVTLGLMGATVYFGQRALDRSDRRDRDLHQSFVMATIASYSLTALLAVLSPPPLIRRDETSTTTIHKTLAWVHAAGMIVTPILGAVLNRRSSSFRDRAHVHQIAAYLTTTVFAASMIVITF